MTVLGLGGLFAAIKAPVAFTRRAARALRIPDPTLARWVDHAQFDWSYQPGGGGIYNHLLLGLRYGVIRRYVENYHRQHGRLPTGSHHVKMSYATDGTAEYHYAPPFGGRSLNWHGVLEMDVTSPPGPLPPREKQLAVRIEAPRHRRGSCVYCNLPADLVFLESSHVRAIWAPKPVAPGHAILFTREPAGDWFSATRDEHVALAGSIDIARDLIEGRRRKQGQEPPVGYYVHFATGAAPEATEPHLHVDVVPRYQGVAGSATES